MNSNPGATYADFDWVQIVAWWLLGNRALLFTDVILPLGSSEEAGGVWTEPRMRRWTAAQE